LRFGPIVLVATAATFGCGVVRRAANAVAPQPDPPATTRWNATLWEATDTTGDTSAGPHGIAWMAPGSADNHSIRLRIAVHRANPAQKYAWRVHFGKCDNDQGVFGPPAAYRDLTADSTGVAAGYASFALGFPSNGQYFVRVDQIVGPDPAPLICGNFVAPK
jgi:hypothetical protein